MVKQCFIIFPHYFTCCFSTYSSETFLQIANEEVFDWFEASPNGDAEAPIHTTAQPTQLAESTDDIMLLLAKMKDLGEYNIVKNLISNNGSMIFPRI